jgi:hypothetical protein
MWGTVSLFLVAQVFGQTAATKSRNHYLRQAFDTMRQVSARTISIIALIMFACVLVLVIRRSGCFHGSADELCRNRPLVPALYGVGQPAASSLRVADRD